MEIVETGFSDLYIINPDVFEDDRGFFFESYNYRQLNKYGIKYRFLQDNHSRSNYGVLRGLHFQLGENAQTKLVRVSFGSVLDVAVDLRKGSPTYLQNFTIELSAENKLQLLIPKGFAHGFVVTSPTAEFLYKCDKYYNKEAEGGLIYNEPTLNIDWRVPADKVILSEKDSKNPRLNDAIFDYPYEKYTGEKLYGK